MIEARDITIHTKTAIDEYNVNSDYNTIKCIICIQVPTEGVARVAAKKFISNMKMEKDLEAYINTLKNLYKDDDINDGVIEDLENIWSGKV